MKKILKFLAKSYTFFSKRRPISKNGQCPQGYLDHFCWLDRLLLKNVYDLAKNFKIFFKNMLLTLFYLERHVMESKYYFWELIFILMPTRVSRRFLLIGPSFAEKRVWFSQELPNFLQKYVAYTILSRKTCNGEQKLFWELIFILNPTRVLRGFLLKNVYDLAKNFQIFFKNMLLTLFYLERHVMESKNYFWELIFTLMPTRVSWPFLLIGRLLLKNVYDLAKNFKIFFKNMLLTLFYLERHVMESKYYFWELIFMLMPTRVSRRFLLIGPSFAEKRVWFSQELPNFLQNMLLTLFYLERHVMESKNYFCELIFILMPARVLIQSAKILSIPLRALIWRLIHKNNFCSPLHVFRDEIV